MLNVAATSVTGRDLGRAISYAAGLQGEIAVRTPADIVTALGPLGGPFMMDLRLWLTPIWKTLWGEMTPMYRRCAGHAIAGEVRRSGFPEGDVFICDADFAARSCDELSHGRAPSFAPMACAALRAPRYHRHISSGKQGTAAGSGAIIFGRHLGIWKARQIKTS